MKRLYTYIITVMARNKDGKYKLYMYIIYKLLLTFFLIYLLMYFIYNYYIYMRYNIKYNNNIHILFYKSFIYIKGFYI